MSEWDRSSSTAFGSFFFQVFWKVTSWPWIFTHFKYASPGIFHQSVCLFVFPLEKNGQYSVRRALVQSTFTISPPLAFTVFYLREHPPITISINGPVVSISCHNGPGVQLSICCHNPAIAPAANVYDMYEMCPLYALFRFSLRGPQRQREPCPDLSYDRYQVFYEYYLFTFYQ